MASAQPDEAASLSWASSPPIRAQPVMAQRYSSRAMIERWTSEAPS
jgi:hypothetical protein